MINISVILSKMLSQERLWAGPLSPVGSLPLLCVGPMEAYCREGPVVRPHAFELIDCTLRDPVAISPWCLYLALPSTWGLDGSMEASDREGTQS